MNSNYNTGFNALYGDMLCYLRVIFNHFFNTVMNGFVLKVTAKSFSFHFRSKIGCSVFPEHESDDSQIIANYLNLRLPCRNNN